MKVTSSPFASIAPSPLSAQSLSVDQRQLKEQFIPRAACSLRNDSGFSAASQRLAQRRFAASCNSDEVSEVMQSEFSNLLPSSHTISGDWQGRRSKRLPQSPRKIDQYRTLAEADFERSQVTPQDHFEAHDLDERLLGDLRQQLQRYPIARADLVKKTLRFFPEQPLYILLVSSPENDLEQPISPLEPTLGTQIAQELCFSRELLVCLTSDMEPHLVERIHGKSQGNLLDLPL